MHIRKAINSSVYNRQCLELEETAFLMSSYIYHVTTIHVWYRNRLILLTVLIWFHVHARHWRPLQLSRSLTATHYLHIIYLRWSRCWHHLLATHPLSLLLIYLRQISLLTCHLSTSLLTFHLSNSILTCHLSTSLLTCHLSTSLLTCHLLMSLLACHRLTSLLTCHLSTSLLTYNMSMKLLKMLTTCSISYYLASTLLCI